MRLAALRLQRRLFVAVSFSAGAVIDRRQAARGLALAPAFEFVGTLVAGVEQAVRLSLSVACR